MTVQRQIDRLIAIQAAEFFEGIRSGEVQVSSDEFRRWISESPRHVDAFMLVAGQAPLIREVLQSGTVDLAAIRARQSASVVHLDALPAAVDAEEPQMPPVQAAARSAWRWRLVGASLAAALSALAVALWVAPAKWEHLETSRGEQRAVTLADGSIVNLDAKSIAEVQLRDTTRDIRLLQGQAIFKVAHDRQRPFSVHTATATVRAVGTEFVVSTSPEGTTISVLEGKVEVVPNATASVRPLPRADRLSLGTAVAAGQEARVAQGGTVKFDAHADVSSSVAWLRRKLVFRHTLLEGMVAEVNRYNNSIQLHLEGVPPGVYRFSGTFDGNDPVSLADLLAREAGLYVERRGNDIYIREAAPVP